MKKGISHFKKGFYSVEAILAVSLFGLLVSALTGVYFYGEESFVLSGNRQRAILLAEEGIEAVRNIRDGSFSNLNNGTYGISVSSNQYNLSGSSDVNGIFTRTINISSVDSNTKSITSNVTWQQNPQRDGSISLITYLTNWQRLGFGDWANPNTLVGTLDIAGNNDGTKIQVSGSYAYVIRAGGTPDFVIVDISDPTNPSISGSLSLTGIPQNIFVLGNYAYIASNTDTQELQIINITNPNSPNIAGTLDIAGNANARGIYVLGNTAYVTRDTGGGNTFNIVNVTNPNSPSLLGSATSSQIEYEVVVSGNYAYVATGSNTQELRVMNISNPATPTLASFLNLSGNTNAITTSILGNTLLMGQGANLHAVNITNPLAPALYSSYATGGTINDISLIFSASSYAFLGTTNATSEMQVINITNPSSMVLVGDNNVPASVLGLSYDTTSDRVYLVTGNNAGEFYTIAP